MNEVVSLSAGEGVTPDKGTELKCTFPPLYKKSVEPQTNMPRSPAEAEDRKAPTLLQGSDGEHKLQDKYDTRARAINFYEKQMLDYLAPSMIEFIARQEFLFVATADRHGECDNTSKFGQPGFIRVLGNKYVLYPEYRGNGVYANSRNLSENPISAC